MTTTPTTDNAQKAVRSYKEIAADYAFDPDIFAPDDARTRRVKEVIFRQLSPADRIIILLYADCGSVRALGKRLGMSHMTAWKEVRRIREEIKRRCNL